MFGYDGPVQELKKSTIKCPECIEAHDAALRAQEKAQAQVAKAEQQEAKALTIYKSQATTIAKHIIDAGDDAELRAELTTMLKNCKLLWANKVRQTVCRTNETTPSQWDRSTKLQESLAGKKQKVELMCERAEILHAQELARSGKGSEKTKELEKQCDEWRVISTKMSHAVKWYETKVLKELGGVEEDVSVAWMQALDLMKRS
jgi:hypothetical protein